ncbi:MAG: serine/threonine protein kinase, partial [bacterium]|nr:serine/threonine protein kinase [bacterium]
MCRFAENNRYGKSRSPIVRRCRKRRIHQGIGRLADEAGSEALESPAAIGFATLTQHLLEGSFQDAHSQKESEPIKSEGLCRNEVGALIRGLQAKLLRLQHDQTIDSSGPFNPALVGRTISHYKILDEIGKGGMAVVYKAEDTKLRRAVALKFLSSETIESEELKTRFLQEAEAAAALDHPNICTVHEIDEADGRTFLAMAFVEGESLAEKTKKRPLPLDEALDIAAQIAAGLHAAHRKGIVHRDIKSSNVMIDGDGRVKIMDFGIAHLAGGTRITKAGTIMGTPAYMSPEQARA